MFESFNFAIPALALLACVTIVGGTFVAIAFANVISFARVSR